MSENLNLTSGWSRGLEVRARSSARQSFSARAQNKRVEGGESFEPDRLLAAIFPPQTDPAQPPKKFHQKFTAEIASLARERDPEMFFEGLLALGKRMELEGDLQAAGSVYSAIQEVSPFPALSKRALQNLDARMGKGAVGLRAELLLRDFSHAATDHRTILPMIAGSALYQLTRSLTLGRLAMSTRATWFTRGFGARLSSSVAGYLVEVPTFSISSRGLMELSGQPVSWDAGSVGKDLLGAGLTLGTLKLSSAAGNQGFLKLHGANEISAVTRLASIKGFSRPVLTQGALFAGLMGSHSLDEAMALRPHVDGATRVTDTLATMVSLGVGSDLGHRILGPRFRAWQSELEHYARHWQQVGPRRPSNRGSWLDPARAIRESPFQVGLAAFVPPALIPSGDAPLGSREWTAVTLLAMGAGLLGMVTGRSKGLGPQLEKIKTSTVAEGAKLIRESSAQEWKIEGLEDSKASSQELLEQTKAEIQAIEARILAVQEGLPQEAQENWRSRIEKLKLQSEFWLRQIQFSNRTRPVDQGQYIHDIQIGIRLLLGKTGQLSAEVFSEPLRGTFNPNIGLNRPRPVRLFKEREKKRGALPALANYDVGFGKDLAVRKHQIAALKRVRGWIEAQRSKYESSQPLKKEEQELLQATIVMPVGTGKTRTMVASFATAIDLGLFRPGFDKFIILNHTDRIHQQNLEVSRILNEYFRVKFGRSIRVTEYKSDKKDLSGDLIVVSVPSASGEQRREVFKQDLEKALGDSGRITMVAVDEVHHLGLGLKAGRKSWQDLLLALRGVSPQFLRLGFTATPTGHEGAVLYRMSEWDAMSLGITPRSYLVKVEGIDLTDVPIRGIDFSERDLSRTLMSGSNRQKRNSAVYQALEKHGLRKLNLSPSRKSQLEASLIFAADLAHAQTLAEDYLAYFSHVGDGVKGRRLLLLGKNRGKISTQEIKEPVRKYDSGEIDGIIALVSGNTRAIEEILRLVKEGKIEAVFTVDALVEGADLYMFTHQVGARPTFSPIKKGQERGRVNRRGPKELDSRDRLISDPPKILFDVIDRYHKHGHALIPYGLVMGARGHAKIKEGYLYDILAGETVGDVNREGRLQATEAVTPPLQKPKPSVEYRLVGDRELAALVENLKKVFVQYYGGNLEEMAWDLGESPISVEQLFAGKGWKNRYWFLRRMASLLYQEDRDIFVKAIHKAKGVLEKTVSDEDHQLLQEAFQVMEKFEGPLLDTGGEMRVETPWGKEEFTFNFNALHDLKTRSLGDLQWRDFWRILTLYFRGKMVEKPVNDFNRKASRIYHRMIRYFYAREEWLRKEGNFGERLKWRIRKNLALRFGGIRQKLRISGVPQLIHDHTPLVRWLHGQNKESLNSKAFCNQVRALLVGLGVGPDWVNQAIVRAIFEKKRWNLVEAPDRENLLDRVRRVVAIQLGGELPQDSKLPGVPIQNVKSSLTRWLRGKKVLFGKGFSSKVFYNQVRALLVGLGEDPGGVDRAIAQEVFEKKGWNLVEEPDQENLLDRARRLVAIQLGGELPSQPVFSGIPQQTEKAPLTLWLKGNKFKVLGGVTAKSLYAQVKILLVGFGEDPLWVDRAMVREIFEERGWKRVEAPDQENLLDRARRLVAIKMGGELLENFRLPGMATQKREFTLRHWLKEGETRSRFSSKNFYSKVKGLLMGLGEDPEWVDRAIVREIFEKKGWNLVQDPDQENLLDRTRRLVAIKMGGEFPTNPGIPGVSFQQGARSPLTRWLKGEKILFVALFTPEKFYNQIRALLVGLGESGEEADRLIRNESPIS